MNKQLKLSYLLFFASFGLVLTWRTLTSFFNGMGVVFVLMLALFIGNLILVSTNNYVFKRTTDLLLIQLITLVLEFVVYLPFEFGSTSAKVLTVFLNIQNVYMFLDFFIIAYTVLRFIWEMKDIKIQFVESLLGNKTKVKKTKKEINNGSLEDKPNNTKKHHFDDEDDDNYTINQDEY